VQDVLIEHGLYTAVLDAMTVHSKDGSVLEVGLGPWAFHLHTWTLLPSHLPFVGPQPFTWTLGHLDTRPLSLSSAA